MNSLFKPTNYRPGKIEKKTLEEIHDMLQGGSGPLYADYTNSEKRYRENPETGEWEEIPAPPPRLYSSKGHAITILDSEKGKDGKLNFLVVDPTDPESSDGHAHPRIYDEGFIRDRMYGDKMRVVRIKDKKEKENDDKTKE